MSRFAAAAFVALLLPVAAAAAPPAPRAVITLDHYRTRWSLNATVGGKTGQFLLDTGAGLTMITEATAAEAGCKPWGRITGFNMFGKRDDTERCEGLTLDIQGGRYRPGATGLIDMAANNPKDAALLGIVALDNFAGEAITLDLAHGRLVVESPESLAARTRGMKPIPIRLVREVEGLSLSVMVGLPTASGTLWFELDSGNGGTVLVGKHVAAMVGLNPAIEGKQTADFLLADGVRVQTADAFAADLIYDGNLGMPFLKHWIVTLDLSGSRAWIAPAQDDGPAAAP